MDNIFTLHPSACRLDILDAFHKKLEQVQSLSDCFMLLSDYQEHQVFLEGFSLISDLLCDLKKLSNVLIETKNKCFEDN